MSKINKALIKLAQRFFVGGPYVIVTAPGEKPLKKSKYVKVTEPGNIGRDRT